MPANGIRKSSSSDLPFPPSGAIPKSRSKKSIHFSRLWNTVSYKPDNFHLGYIKRTVVRNPFRSGGSRSDESLKLYRGPHYPLNCAVIENKKAPQVGLEPTTLRLTAGQRFIRQEFRNFAPCCLMLPESFKSHALGCFALVFGGASCCSVLPPVGAPEGQKKATFFRAF